MPCFVSLIVSAPGCMPHSSQCYEITKRSELIDLLKEELEYQGYPKSAISDFDIRMSWPRIRQNMTYSRDSYHRSNQMTLYTITEEEYEQWHIQNFGYSHRQKEE